MRCNKCGQFIYDWKPPHECTRFFVTCEDYDMEMEPFWVENPAYLMKKGRYKPTHEDAAEAWARWFNEDGDYALMNETLQITVTRDGDSRIFDVSAEPSIDYKAELVEVVNDEEV